MGYPGDADAAVAAALRRLPDAPAADELGDEARARSLFARAEHHGLAGVLFGACERAGASLPPSVAAAQGARAVARALDHDAHMALLGEIDRALSAARVPAVVLKGPLFADRFYAVPSSRDCTDVDLLVEPTELDRAQDALGGIGYVTEDARRDVWSRREHHHIVLVRGASLPIELHFCAYRGFGREMPSAPLIARSRAIAPLQALRVLAAEDELVYLAVHAAGHRFGRLSWLYDLHLLAASASDEELRSARENARRWGFSRALALAGTLLADLFRTETGLGALGQIRGPLLEAVVTEPRRPLLRAATRFAYSAMLGDSVGASLRYARAASVDRARRLLGLER